MRTLVFAAVVLAPGLSWAAACPVGTMPGFDNFGNQICKDMQTGDTRSVQGSVRNCPPGTHFDIDQFGNKVCKSFDTGLQFYDTSEGCPVGFIQAFDNFGKPTCRKM